MRDIGYSIEMICGLPVLASPSDIDARVPSIALTGAHAGR
jgi:hypothetical protein